MVAAFGQIRDGWLTQACKYRNFGRRDVGARREPTEKKTEKGTCLLREVQKKKMKMFTEIN